MSHARFSAKLPPDDAGHPNSCPRTPKQSRASAILRALPRSLTVCVLGGGLASSALANTLVWPGAAPCSGTLQACISAAAGGDSVEMRTNAVINESVSVTDLAVSLRAGEGYHPRFSAGRNIVVDFSPVVGGGPTVPFQLEYSGFTLEGGHFEFTASVPGTAIIERLHLVQGSAPGALYISSLSPTGDDSGGVASITVRDCHIEASLTATQAVYVAIGRPGRIVIEDNLIHSVAGSASDAAQRVAIDAYGNSQNALLDIRRNRILAHPNADVVASRFKTSIRASTFVGTANFRIRIADNELRSGFASNHFGVYLTVASGLLDATLVNNSIETHGRALQLSDNSAGQLALSGVIRNNIIKVNTPSFGISLSPAGALSNDYNLIFGSSGNSLPLGPHTLLLDPKFVSARNLRLRADSPARDAGDPTARTAGPVVLGALPPADGDGLRRVKSNQIDIGAFEFGDDSFTHFNLEDQASTTIDRPSLNNNPGALMQITRSDGGGGALFFANTRPMTQFYSESELRWKLRSDDGQNLGFGAAFNLLEMTPGGTVGNHVATAATMSNSRSALAAPWANLPIDSIFLVSATRGAGLSVTANPHPFGASYSNGNWSIGNTDGSALPVNSAYTVYAQAPSRSAFTHSVSAANSATAVVSIIDHSGLNGFACAAPQVSINGNGQMPTPQASVRYDSSLRRWYLLDETPATQFVAGNQYFVVFDPRRTLDSCLSALLSDGFE